MWGGGGGYAARLFILLSFPCSADHERDWPPCIVVFFGLATNTLNVRNNKQQQLVVQNKNIVITTSLQCKLRSTANTRVHKSKNKEAVRFLSHRILMRRVSRVKNYLQKQFSDQRTSSK